MRRLARFGCITALLALTFLASTPASFGQGGRPDSARSRSRGPVAPQERSAGPRAEHGVDARGRLRRVEPPGFARWMREMGPAQRRQLERRLQSMPMPQRERFFRDWRRLSREERRAFSDRLTPGEARRRELPPRLRTPQMRERLEAMSPEQRRAFAARARDWSEMRPGERLRMRSRLERFGALSADDQQRLVEERFGRRGPEERARILRELRAASQQMQQRRDGRGEGAAAPAPPPAPPEGAPPGPPPR